MSLMSMMLGGMTKGGYAVREHLNEITENPKEEQEKLLFSLLEKSRDSELGKKLGFADIKSVADFQEKVPFTDYDYYSEMIERMTQGAENILTSDKIIHYNMTSGTLGAPKRIPVTQTHVNNFQSYYAKYMNALATETCGGDWMKGKGFTLTEGKYKILPSGASCGSASSLMAAKIGKMFPGVKIDMMGAMYSSPYEARCPQDGTPTRYLHTLFALREPNITYANCTFSSYLLEIMRYIEDNWQTLVNTIETGDIPRDIIADDNLRAILKKKLKPSKKRADELRKIFENGFDTPVVPQIWKKIAYFFCVGGAGFKIYTDKLIERYVGKDIPFLFLGLSASEGLFSVPFEPNNTSSVFIPDSVFMEFISEKDGKIYTLDKLNEGEEYEIVVTNLCGLFRYKMRDVIRVVGKYNNTPTMEFVKRAGFAISMYGEKTSEQALQYMAQKALEEYGVEMYDYAVCPDDDDAPGGYVLCLELRSVDNREIDREKLRELAQKHLSFANPSIGKKMDTGVVKRLEIKLLQPETFLLYRDLMVMKGRSAAQLKPVHVLSSEYLKRFFYKLEEK